MKRKKNAKHSRLNSRLLACLQAINPETRRLSIFELSAKAAAPLMAADLVAPAGHGKYVLTSAGRAFLRRNECARTVADVDPYLGQHLKISRQSVQTGTGTSFVRVDDTESPLAWLARRKGKDGQALIELEQFEAGERLRVDFTRAQLMPRTTSSWDPAVTRGINPGGSGARHMTEIAVTARQRIRHALDAVGPEFSGLLIDVCCFLKGLEDIERERKWPPRSAKVVLQLGLDRLARHYGYSSCATGPAHAPIRSWVARDAAIPLD